MHHIAKFALIASLAILTASMQEAQSAPGPTNSPDLKDDAENYLEYFVVRQPISQFLIQFGRDVGVQVESSSAVKGLFENVWLAGGAEAILNDVSARFDLDWFTFNGVSYVSGASETQLRLVRLGDVSAQMALDVLAEAGLLIERFPVTETSQGTALALTGPPKLLGLSEAVIETLTAFEPVLVEEESIVVRRGSDVFFEPIRTDKVPIGPIVPENIYHFTSSGDS